MNNKAKLVIAVICLVVAAVVVAMNMGLFGSGSAARQGTATNTGQTNTAGGNETPAEPAETGGLLKKDKH